MAADIEPVTGENSEPISGDCGLAGSVLTSRYFLHPASSTPARPMTAKSLVCFIKIELRFLE
jgi:hypothetical protein